MTKQLCGSDYSSGSMIIPTTNYILDEIARVDVRSETSIAFKELLVANIKDRFDFAEANDMLAIATLLDPRFKTAGFARACTEPIIKAKVVDMVNDSSDKEKEKEREKKEENLIARESSKKGKLKSIFKFLRFTFIKLNLIKDLSFSTY